MTTEPTYSSEMVVPDPDMTFDPLSSTFPSTSQSDDPCIKIEYDLYSNNDAEEEKLILPHNTINTYPSEVITWQGQSQGQSSGSAQYYFNIPPLSTVHDVKHPVVDNGQFNHVILPGSFMCRYFKCTESFGTTILRNKHERAVHIQDEVQVPPPPVPPMFPQGSFSEVARTQALKVTKQKLKVQVTKNKILTGHSCPHCSKKFPKSGHLTQHIRLHTGERPYKCNFCDLQFSDTTQRTRHENKMHKLKPSDPAENGDPDVVQKCQPNSKIYNCSYCAKPFTKLSHLTQHIRVHTGELRYQCRHCDEKFRDTTQRIRHETSVHKGGVKRHECTILGCDHTAETPAALTTHMRTHTGEKPYACEVCSKKFYIKSHLVSHSRIHTGEKPYKCRMCELTFSDTSRRKRHERLIHTGEKIEKRHLCEECGQSFTQSILLAEHLNSHSGEKPYKCEYTSCNAHFARKSSLRMHMRIHTGEKPYKCEFCPEKFVNTSNKKRHELTHTGEKAFDCHFCTKKFATADGLKLHERTHTGEKPHVCRFCPAAYACISNLKYHVKVNHSEPDKSFECNICEKKFVRTGEYKRHMLTHSKDEPFKCSFCEATYKRKHKLKCHVIAKHKDESDETKTVEVPATDSDGLNKN